MDDRARIEIEDRFPRNILQDLIARGHRFQKIGRKGEVRNGYAAAIVVDTANQRVEGGSRAATVACGGCTRTQDADPAVSSPVKLISVSGAVIPTMVT